MDAEKATRITEGVPEMQKPLLEYTKKSGKIVLMDYCPQKGGALIIRALELPAKLSP